MPNKKRILLAEDEEHLLEAIKLNLELEGYKVSTATNGKKALQIFKEERFNLVILDVMMPEIDGFVVAETIRLENSEVPIMFLTAKNTNEDKIAGLKKGADDYLTKPFDFDVLLARIRARTRTATGKNAAQLRFADLFLDTEKHEVIRGGQRLDLTRTEFSILECLMRAAGRVVTRDRIIELVWGDRDVSENNLDVFIRYLRAKVDGPGLPRLLHTERGLGYSLREGTPE